MCFLLIQANLILVPFPTHRKQVPSMMILGRGEAEGELVNKTPY